MVPQKGQEKDEGRRPTASISAAEGALSKRLVIKPWSQVTILHPVCSGLAEFIQIRHPGICSRLPKNRLVKVLDKVLQQSETVIPILISV